jgi:UDP-N-acetyl-D-mannosaminuronate dehydrogenase
MKKIGFIGIGKLGLDCAEVMAEKHEVRGYDIYPRTSDSVKVCDIDELVNESEWIFIAVPTPHAEGYDGSVPSSHCAARHNTQTFLSLAGQTASVLIQSLLDCYGFC